MSIYHEAGPLRSSNSLPLFTVPYRWLSLAFALWALTWCALPWLTELVPPIDNLEQLVWSQSFELGYYKHPPLPTWILIAAEQAFGRHLLLTEILAISAMVVGGYYLWRLAQALLGRSAAALAVLATACMAFYSYRAHAYNHNTVLVPFVYASTWYLLSAVRSARTSQWLLCGVSAAGAALSKYQFAIIVATWVLIALRLQLYRRADVRRGALLAGGVALLLLTPHLIWLVRHDFMPIHYASSLVLARLSLGARLNVALAFLLQQLRDALAAAAMIYLAFRWSQSRSVESTTAGAAAPDTRIWILGLGIAPLALVLAMGLLSGSRLENHWGTTCMQFVALPLIAWAMRRRPLPGMGAMLSAFLLVQALAISYVVISDLHARSVTLDEGRLRAFDPAAFSRAVTDDWHAVTGQPLRYVAGDWSAFVAVYSPEHPQVLIEGNPRFAPWISMSDLERCGAVYFAPLEPPPGKPIARTGRFLAVDYHHHARHAVPVTVSWSVVAPTAACTASRLR
jgi:4-amino-4-deoxy-L-arabinose transferase-like glycosyltransferase